jgi:hypothetical protein
MSKLIIYKVIAFIIVLSVSEHICEANHSNYTGPGLFGKSDNNKSVRPESPRSAKKAIKKQEAKDKKQKKEYERLVKESQQRSIEIQSPEVQARMKQNQKDTEAKYKSKKKKTSEATKKGSKKYK